MKEKKTFVNLLQEFSIPLIFGVIVALIVVNVNHHFYEMLIETPLHKLPGILFDGDHSTTDTAVHGWEHYTTLYFLVNDVFMVFFFGIAAKEITEACLPGGDLNPVSKAINPLLGTLGGVVGPVVVFFALNRLIGSPEWTNGWGIPTATDIALAWLVARFCFGANHPAVSFLLLLAIADDAIGLLIIAFAYPDPEHPTMWINALWILPGVLAAYAMARKNVKSWVPYVFIGGGFSWYGLHAAHLHPALALVLIVPFMPSPKKDSGIFGEEGDFDAPENKHSHSTLENFEHSLKLPVDLGLFFFAFANAGVPFTNLTNLTWIVFLALLIGKMAGITLFSFVGNLIGIPFPTGMGFKHLVTASIIAAIGLTVALFVSAQAFVEIDLQGAAKMGALFSATIALPAFVIAKILKVKEIKK